MNTTTPISSIILLAILLAATSSQAASLSKQPIDQQQSMVSVQTSSGRLLGSSQLLQLTATNNATVHRFLGVPYARPPVGELRFARPQELPADSQHLLLDATRFAKTCPQFRHLARFISPLLNLDQEHQTSEDCLQLNVFAPASVGSAATGELLEVSKQLPVIVWIPGEGFDFADARQFDGAYLAHKTQSVVVTVQYRVGVLGFLRAPELNATGNMGLYDQLLALQWIKRNILAFGGDPARVTLMGRFSGAMSISALISAPQQHLLRSNQDQSPLFSRAAMLSGVAVPDWIVEHQNQSESRLASLKRAALGQGLCQQPNQLAQCIKSLPVDKLLSAASYGWRLVVDQELVGSRSPAEAVKADQLLADLDAVLLGETGQEGTLCLYRHMLDSRNAHFAQMIEEDRLTSGDLYDIVRDDSLTYFQDQSSAAGPIRAAIETLAAGEQLEQANLRDKYLAACSAYMVKSHSQQLKRNILARNQYAHNRMDSSKRPVEVFHYELRYKPSFSLAPDYIKTAAHGDDIPLIFGLVYSQARRDINEADLLMTRKMMAYIGNFVHGNNPLPVRTSSIGSETAGAANETSMDESENQTPASEQQLLRRNWASEGKLHPIELTENDLSEISSKSRTVGQQDGQPDNGQHRAQHQKGYKTSVRVVVVENPSQWSEFLDEPRVVQQQQQGEESSNELALIKSQRQLDTIQTRRQQLDEQALYWTQRRFPSSQPMSQLNESSFMTILLFSSCLIIFVLTSLCFGLCLVIFRKNLAHNNAKQIQQHFACSSSSCNICDESQRGSIEAVLDGNRKDVRNFGNVFAKLRNQTNHQQPARASPAPTPTTTAAVSNRNATVDARN